MNNRNLLQRFGLAALAAGAIALGQTSASAATNYLGGVLTGGNLTWRATNEYVMTNYTYVLDGTTLTIEPGTVVRGRNGTAPNFGSLFICQGAKIIASGTHSKPIIFTAEDDDLADPEDKLITDRGLWGGVVILGKARISKAVNAAGDAASPKYELYEGLADTQISGQFIHRFGGSDDNDNSGVFRFVSMRHGGQKLSPDKEINGLSLGGVGRGTTIEYVEALSFADDGFEFFGGSVNTRYLVSAFNDDDAFDTDMGFSGKNQFWFAIQSNDKRDNGGELNGEPNERNDGKGVPVSNFEVFNGTFIGAGANAGGTANNNGFLLRRYTQARVFDSIITDFNGQPLNGGGPQTGASPVFQDNIWWSFTTPTFTNVMFTTASLTNRTSANPSLNGISRTANGGLDPRPASGGAAFQNYRTPADDFYVPTDYVGAFDSKDLWIKGWTFLDQGGFTPASDNLVTVSDQTITGNVTWNSTNVYLLTNYVYVLSGATLTIEPGTVIKGRNGTAPNFGSLYVCRGGKIIADGKPHAPIIFTAETDDLADPSDLGPTDRQLWGGLVIFGNARINKAVNATGDAASPKYEVYEGLEDLVLESNNVHRFGGNNDDDNSGILRYVSIRHGGQKLSPDKEINGLSLGGVGRGTTIECVEAYATADDGFEFFGGSVNTKFLVSAFNDDDSFDTDMGYNGKNQFWFAIQSNDKRDNGGEFNGEPNERNDGTGVPASTFEVYNATYIGAGKTAGGTANNNGFLLRRYSQAKLYNSIVTDFNGQPLNGSAPQTGASPTFQDNIWWDFATPTFTATMFTTAANNNRTAANPLITSISREANFGLDPRPGAGGPAFSLYRATPVDGFFTAAPYVGAFSDVNWAGDWTALAAECVMNPTGAGLKREVPEIALTVTTPNDGSSATLAWLSAFGRQYRVQSTSDLSIWTDESAWTDGTGGTLTHVSSVPGTKKMFRVVVR